MVYDWFMAKARNKNRFISELLFWFHTLIVLILIFAGLFVSVWWVVLIIVLHRAQLIIFRGCIITKFEEREGGIGKGEAYFHLATKRFFGINLSRHGVRLLSLAVSATGLILAIAATHWHFRIHL